MAQIYPITGDHCNLDVLELHLYRLSPIVLLEYRTKCREKSLSAIVGEQFFLVKINGLTVCKTYRLASALAKYNSIKVKDIPHR
jgi:hypothetical protein